MASAENLASEFTQVVDSVLDVHAGEWRPPSSYRFQGDEVVVNGLIYHRGVLPAWRAGHMTYDGSFVDEPFAEDELVRKVIPETEYGYGKASRMQFAVGEGHAGRIFRILDQTIGVKNDLISTHDLTTSRELDDAESAELLVALNGVKVRAKDLEKFRRLSAVESARHTRHKEEWLTHYSRESHYRATVRYRGRSRRPFPRRARAAN